MRKVSLMVFIAAFAVMAVAAQGALAKEKKAKPASTGTEQARWDGTIVRSDKDASTLTVRKRGGNVEKVIHYGSSTKWTTDKGTKPVEMSDVKDGDRVICLGKFDDKGDFQAEQIDKRAPH